MLTQDKRSAGENFTLATVADFSDGLRRYRRFPDEQETPVGDRSNSDNVTRFEHTKSEKSCYCELYTNGKGALLKGEGTSAAFVFIASLFALRPSSNLSNSRS